MLKPYSKIKPFFRQFIRQAKKYAGYVGPYQKTRRFIFVGLVILIFFPLLNFFSYIWADKGEIRTIELFPKLTEKDISEDYNLGWWNEDKALSSPDMSAEALINDFSSENSSFYQGGKFSISFSSFLPLTDLDTNESGSEESELPEIDGPTEASEANGGDGAEATLIESEDPGANETEDIPAIGIENITENENSGSEEINDAVPAEDTTTLVSPVGDESGNEEGTINTSEQTEENDSSHELDQVEIIDPETENQEFKVLEPAITNTTSFLQTIENFTKAGIARAQDFLSTRIDSLADLGEFNGATLNLSLAIHHRTDKLENSKDVAAPETASEPEIVGTDSESAPVENEADNDTETGEPWPESGMLIPEENEVEIIEADNSADTVEVMEPEEPSSFEKIFLNYFPQARAQSGELGSAKIIIWYSLESEPATSTATGSPAADRRLWHKLDTITADSLSNGANGGYLNYNADFISTWEDIDSLSIRLEGVYQGESFFATYLDSLWLEVTYDPETDLEILEKRQRWEEALSFLNGQSVLKFGDEETLNFEYIKNENRLWDNLAEIIGLADFWRDVEINVRLIDAQGKILDAPLVMFFENDGRFSIKLPDELRQISPGTYTLLVSIVDRSGEKEEIFEYSFDIDWGILAMNFNKSIFRTNDQAYIQMAVLDESGHTVCDAGLELNIIYPDRSQEVRYTGTGGISLNPECGPESITDQPDYFTYFDMTQKGWYEFELKANTAKGIKVIREKIEVKGLVGMEVERQGPTRIMPSSEYAMVINIKANKDFRGDIREIVPVEFKITGQRLEMINVSERDPFGPGYGFEEIGRDIIEKDLTWHDVDIKKGDEFKLTYIFDAPDRSPELFLLGPLTIGDFAEARQWQIASDALNKRARTVMFMAGTYNGGAAAGQSTNSDYVLSAFNWRLAETGVDIKNAYVVMETQFEAYNSTGLAYTGYKLGFDACEGASCSSAFGTGGGQILDDNSNTLAYDEAESNIVTLLLDVSSETQIAGYTGNGALMDSQFGYSLKNNTTKTSIANVSAILVITYTYDIDSENLTNTVIYPLRSDVAGDSGTRRASQAACTADNNCPVFNYKMDIPEWPGVATTTNRLSQWFKFFANNYNSGTTDVDPYLDIQTINQDSGAFHLEGANNNNGNMPNMYFPAWTNYGFAENEDQQTEFFINIGTNYLLGGEVTETYMASSTATTKTRTVSYPMGLITNGNTTSLSSTTVAVYFPENGTGTGKVTVKSAWVRLNIHGSITATQYNITASTKTGNNAVSGNYVYTYRSTGLAVKPNASITHVIPNTDYAELQSANAQNGKPVTVNLTYGINSFGGASAELMITYAYTEETSGYLSSLRLFGGQSAGAPATSTVLAVANAVFPEDSGKTIYAAGLHASFLNSNSTGNNVPVGTVFYLDANLAISDPACNPVYRAEPDDINSYSEIIKDVKSAMNTTDNQAYSACYADDDPLVSDDGAKMNGQLIYTYGWTNEAPTGTFITASTSPRIDGSGMVDIGLEIDDSNDQDCRARLEYVAGADCDFTSPLDPTLDESDGNTTADYGDPKTENDNSYQIGNASGYITTASGSNSVFADWLAADDVGLAEGIYCLRLTANDLNLDQATSATTTVYIDTKAPTRPGAPSLSARSGNAITLAFGATTTETNFLEYKIFYKEMDGTAPIETDSVLASTSDPNLGEIEFNSYATTTIASLSAFTSYSFSVWAYDAYGNRASSSYVDIKTNNAPTGVFNSAVQKDNGSGAADIAIEVDDANNQDTCTAKIEYVAGAGCDFSSPLDPALDEDGANILADFGNPLVIDNLAAYQVGSTSGYIITSPGSNTINFDWFSRSDVPLADGTYCLRLTVNDILDDQLEPATTTITLDNVNPSAPGSLTFGKVETDSIELIYATTSPSTDTNEPASNAYRIYYKPGISGVNENNIEHDDSDLDAYDYNGATSTLVSGLSENTWYVFNIWSYDQYGNKATATEIAIKTSATLTNVSLTFVNPVSFGGDNNIVLVDAVTEWVFRAVVTELNGWYSIASTTLRLADMSDNSFPYDDLAFYWDQTSQTFFDISADTENAVTLSANSSSTCSGLTCTLDFILDINKDFLDTSAKYAAEIFSRNDFGTTDTDTYPDFYQVRFPYIEQTHYRWRFDNGGE